MLDNFLKQLKQLQEIRPSEEFSKKSLRLIFASPQNALVENSWRTLLIRISLVGATAAFALLVVSKSSIPMKVAGLDAYDLRAEAQGLETNLNLVEIEESALQSKQVNTALEESAKSDPGNLNTMVLNREVDDLSVINNYDSSIDKALNEIAN
ncbi:MAG: hypothetical protein Q8L47_03120 [bacterium]|nr:hypothetical protein [bacterium]